MVFSLSMKASGKKIRNTGMESLSTKMAAYSQEIIKEILSMAMASLSGDTAIFTKGTLKMDLWTVKATSNIHQAKCFQEPLREITSCKINAS